MPTKQKRKLASNGSDNESGVMAEFSDVNKLDDMVVVDEEDREIVVAIDRIAACSDKCEAALRRSIEEQSKGSGLSIRDTCDATIAAARDLHSAIDAVNIISSNNDCGSRGDGKHDLDADGVGGRGDEMLDIADQLRQAHLQSFSHVFGTDIDAVRHEAGFGTSVRDVESLASVLALGADVTSSHIEAQMFMEMVSGIPEDQGSGDTANDAQKQRATESGDGDTSGDGSSDSSSGSGSGSGSDSCSDNASGSASGDEK